jgi:hypothetical protein
VMRDSFAGLLRRNAPPEVGAESKSGMPFSVAMCVTP